MEAIMLQIQEYLTVERVSAYGSSLIRIAMILAAALITGRLVARSVQLLKAQIIEVTKRHRPGEPLEQIDKRTTTIEGILRKTIKVVVWVVALVMVLQELNFDIGPILASAGVVGLAVGFGAQNLVRDVISGLFMLVENQISVNDIAIINGTAGVVEEVNLRTTVLRSVDGTVHIFPNGAITSLSNMTHEFSYYVFEVGVAYKEDTDRVVHVLREIAEEVRQDSEMGPLIMEPLDVLGVDKFDDSAVVIKVRIKTMPSRQFQVGREMNRRIKKRFDAERIEIPFPHRSIYFGEASLPFKLQLDGSTREQLKQIVRDVLAEEKTQR